jgi:kynurenine formamidase
MLVDLTIAVTPKIRNDAQTNLNKASFGHLGTHFDVMDKEFPLEFTERPGIVFDVSEVCSVDLGEVSKVDIDMDLIAAGMFVAFHTGYMERVPYGGKTYFKEHPQLSQELIAILVEKGVAIIGIDCAGLRSGKEHTPTDQYCADRNVFVVENLCSLRELLSGKITNIFKANTYPMNFTGMSGLPCRVIAEL